MKINVELELQSEAKNQKSGRVKFGGLHSDIATITMDEKKIVISSGFGCGHTDIYLAVDGRRVGTVSGRPLLEALAESALTEASKDETYETLNG